MSVLASVTTHDVGASRRVGSVLRDSRTPPMEDNHAPLALALAQAVALQVQGL
jgi:hypothetical protein